MITAVLRRQPKVVLPFGIGRNIRDGQQYTSSSQDRPPESDGSKKYDLGLITKYIHQWSMALQHRADNLALARGLVFSRLGSHINRVSGYEEIEALKKNVVEQEARMNATRLAAKQAKATYDKAVVHRSNSQREVNELLQRKSKWTDSDVSHFTALVRQDHVHEQQEASAKRAVQEIEDAVDREFGELLRSILTRYHEEQVWSDKIRSVSTYGSLVALTLNLVIFVLAIVVVEPWKRRRLSQAFERKVVEMSLENAEMLRAGLKEIHGCLEEQGDLLSKMKWPKEVREPDLPGGVGHHRARPDGSVKEIGGVIATTATIAGLAQWWFGS